MISRPQQPIFRSQIEDKMLISSHLYLKAHLQTKVAADARRSSHTCITAASNRLQPGTKPQQHTEVAIAVDDSREQQQPDPIKPPTAKLQTTTADSNWGQNIETTAFTTAAMESAIPIIIAAIRPPDEEENQQLSSLNQPQAVRNSGFPAMFFKGSWGLILWVLVWRYKEGWISAVLGTKLLDGAGCFLSLILMIIGAEARVAQVHGNLLVVYCYLMLLVIADSCCRWGCFITAIGFCGGLHHLWSHFTALYTVSSCVMGQRRIHRR